MEYEQDNNIFISLFLIYLYPVDKRKKVVINLLKNYPQKIFYLKLKIKERGKKYYYLFILTLFLLLIFPFRPRLFSPIDFPFSCTLFSLLPMLLYEPLAQQSVFYPHAFFQAFDIAPGRWHVLFCIYAVHVVVESLSAFLF